MSGLKHGDEVMEQINDHHLMNLMVRLPVRYNKQVDDLIIKGGYSELDVQGGTCPSF